MDFSREFFTCTFTYEALKFSFPDHFESIFSQFLKMLTFDAISGNNDRHFYNWGIIVNIKRNDQPYFAPVYDTARGLFWNYHESKIKKIRSDWKHLENYCLKSKPKIGIENRENLNHFEVLESLKSNFPKYSQYVKEVLDNALDVDEERLIQKKYGTLIIENRKEMIKACLKYRKGEVLRLFKSIHGFL